MDVDEYGGEKTIKSKGSCWIDVVDVVVVCGRSGLELWRVNELEVERVMSYLWEGYV